SSDRWLIRRGWWLSWNGEPMDHPADSHRLTHHEADVVGVWRQLLQHETGPWLNGGLYRVERVDDTLVMVADNYDEATPGIMKSTGLSAVSFDGYVWRFTSSWEDGRSGTFILTRVDDDHFEGHVYVYGKRWTPNRWQRVAVAGVRSVIHRPREKRREEDLEK